MGAGFRMLSGGWGLYARVMANLRANAACYAEFRLCMVLIRAPKLLGGVAGNNPRVILGGSRPISEFEAWQHLVLRWRELLDLIHVLRVVL